MKKPPIVEAAPQDQTSMTDQVLLDTLQHASRQIVGQEQHIRHLGPKAQSWDVLCTVVEALRPSQPYGADMLGSMMQDAMSALTARIEAAKPQD